MVRLDAHPELREQYGVKKTPELAAYLPGGKKEAMSGRDSARRAESPVTSEL